MSKLNFIVYLNTYSDACASNNPSLSNFKWTREITGIPAQNPISEALTLAPGESKNLFSGVRALDSDAATEWEIALKPLSTHTYRLSGIAGNLPNFRTPRAIAIDATTEVTTVTNGPIVTFNFTDGTLPDLSSVVVGDACRIGDQFNQLNQGEFKVLAKTATSFTIENQVAYNETVVLGADFEDQIQIYSAAGVQIGDTVIINSGFSLVTQGAYKVTGVAANFIEFYSTALLPQETAILSPGLAVYSAAKSLIYLETDQKVAVRVNGSLVSNMEPFIINDTARPGVFMLKSTVYSLDVQNMSTNTASMYMATVE